MSRNHQPAVPPALAQPQDAAAPTAPETAPAAPLTREDVCRLPPRERLVYVQRIHLRYPRWQAILDEIALCHEMNPVAAEPQCLLVVGPTGAGKSTLIE